MINKDNLNPMVEKVEWLLARIQESIDSVSGKRKANKTKASIIKISLLLSSAGTTILIGLFSTYNVNILKSLALIFSTTITLFTAIEPFFNYRSLWIEHEDATAKFNLLLDRINYYREGNDTMEVSQIDKFLEEYLSIWENLSNNWIEERKKYNEIPHNKSSII
ncbi:MAG: SLATT domain-containing protein [Bacteroidetes bacterium]|nr:SLATT domain-containing protein [Bacteroidota bacterium]